MEENRENGRVRSPIWGLFYKKHKKISLFLEKKMLQTCKFTKIYLLLQHEKSPCWRYFKDDKN
ncbi:hypothetical protein DXB41_06695 [Segatella copri]|nr:hypothetical protein DXB41_06695 [Segatella copri]